MNTFSWSYHETCKDQKAKIVFLETEKKVLILPNDQTLISTNCNSSLQLTKNTFRLSELYSVNTRNKHHLHTQFSSHSCFQKSVQYNTVHSTVFSTIYHRVSKVYECKRTIQSSSKKILGYTLVYFIDEFPLSKECKSL
jgi:hypothetical protein